MRLFFGIPLIGDALVAARKAQDELRAAARLKFANRDQLHCTLAFLGDQDAAAAERAIAAGREAASAGSFPAAVGAAGAFPGPGRPRVIWIGLADDGRRLEVLAASLRSGLQSRGLGFDAKPFHAHVTLARALAPQARAAAQALAALKPAAASMVIDSFSLYESAGGQHRVMETFRLR